MGFGPVIDGLSDRRFTAWVVFHGADHRRFWRIFTARGWRHCSVIVPSYNSAMGLRAGRHSVVLEARTNHVAIDVVYLPADRVAEHMLKQGATCVIKYDVDRRGLRDYVPRGLLTCVSLLKAVCGISAWYVLVPHHLARWLLRNGGQIFEGRNDGENVWLEQSKTRSRNAKGATSAIKGD